MADQLIESRWNPVKLGKSKGAYNIDHQAVSTGWYNRAVDSSGSRRTRLMRYKEMDESSVEISRALDILAEDISSSNADDEEIFNLDIPDESKILKTQLKLLHAAKDMWEQRTGMEMDFFNRVRETLKNGASFWLKQNDGSLKRLAPERIVGYVRDKDDEDIITHYIYDPNGTLLPDDDRKVVTSSTRKKEKEYMNIPISDLVVLKVGQGPYGKSVLDDVYKSWKQMTLVEDAIIIYRVVRAPERRVYYIDVGNLQGPRREQAIEKQRMRLMQKNANRNNQMTAEYDPHSTSEDIFIPTNSQGKGSRIETLPAGQNLGELTDLKWFAKKVAAGLRIPFSMIDVQAEEGTQQPYSDMRVGQVYQAEIRYVGYTKRIQKMFAHALHQNFSEFCRKREIEVPFDVRLMINEPNSFSQYKEIEVNQTLLNVYNSTLQINSLSKKFALQKYLGWEQEDIQYNEVEKLKEKGLTDEIIASMEQHEIDNLVYGDGSLGKKFGLEPPEDNGGFGF